MTKKHANRVSTERSEQMNRELVQRIDVAIEGLNKTRLLEDGSKASRRSVSLVSGSSDGLIADIYAQRSGSPTIKTIVGIAETIYASPSWLAFGEGEPPDYLSNDDLAGATSDRWTIYAAIRKYDLRHVVAVLEIFDGKTIEEVEDIVNAFVRLLGQRAVTQHRREPAKGK